MQNPILEAKREIAGWLKNIDDADLIHQLIKLKNENNSHSEVFHSSNVIDNFDEQFAAGMTSEELLENVSTHIESLTQKNININLKSMIDPLINAKKELIDWVGNLHDLDVIQKLLDLKDHGNYVSQISEPQAEYVVKDDFDERFAKGMSSAEARKRTKTFIENLPWKR